MPWRSAVFVLRSAVVPGPTVYQVALVVRSRADQVEATSPHGAYAALSTLIWAVIWESGTSPFAMPEPRLMTWK